MIAAALMLGAASPQAERAASVPGKGPPPVEAFAELPQLENPQISPDGGHIATKMAVGGRQFLVIIAAGGKRRTIPLDDIDLNWWRWVNSEWLIAGVGQEDDVRGEKWYITRAFGLHVTSPKPVMLTGRLSAQNADDVIWMARDGSARVMVAYQTSIFYDEPGFWPQVDEVDLATGKRRVVQRSQSGVRSWYADGDGVVRIGIGYADDGRSRRVLYRDNAGAGFKVVDRVGRRSGMTTG